MKPAISEWLREQLERSGAEVAGFVPCQEGKHLVVVSARRLERNISTYLLTITLINACLGIAVGTASSE